MTGRLIMNNLLAHATEQVNRYDTFLVDFDKIYRRPIQIQQQFIFSMVKDYRSYCLPRSLDKIVRSKIVTAPLLADTIWNIPSECEKAFFDSNRKRGQNFCGRRFSIRPSNRGHRYPRSSSRGSKPLTKKACSSKFSSK